MNIIGVTFIAVIDHLNRAQIGGGKILSGKTVTRLILPALDGHCYANAQLDDYSAARTFALTRHAPRALRLRARFSHQTGAMRGTAGFGFWNHPLTPGGALIPRHLWFFHGSGESDLQFDRHSPGHGFKAGMLDAAPWLRHSSPRLPAAGDASGVGAASRGQAPGATAAPAESRMLGWAVRAAQHVMAARDQLLRVDMTAWHDYALAWHTGAAVWSIDGVEVMRAPRPPAGPLGLVIWIDNYCAHFNRAGQIGFSLCAAPEPQWLELQTQSIACD